MSRSTIKKKSQSQKLRETFYHLWKIDTEGHDEFDTYYDAKMVAINEHYKNILTKKQGK